MTSQDELLTMDLADAYRQHHCQNSVEWSHIIFNRIRSLQAEVKRQEFVIRLWRDVNKINYDNLLVCLEDIDPDWRDNFRCAYVAAEFYAQEIVEAALGKEVDDGR